jgi:hypothetical protein
VVPHKVMHAFPSSPLHAPGCKQKRKGFKTGHMGQSTSKFQDVEAHMVQTTVKSLKIELTLKS